MADHALIKDAENRGYLTFDKKRRKITYLCGRRHTEDFTNPEEPVRAYLYAWLIVERGYPAERIEVEVLVPRRTPGDWADIVVFKDDRRTDPYLVVEAKKPNCTPREWREAIEQGFGYANSLRTTKYLLVDSFDKSQLFDIANFPPTERDQNRLGTRDPISHNYGEVSQFSFVAGGPTDIVSFSPRDLETRIRRAHAAIWAGGRRDPLTAFDEWNKLLFAKIWDEKHTRNGEPRDMQKAIGESVSQTASRVRFRFTQARRSDPTIFDETEIGLPDDKIVEVVELIQDVGFTLCEIDALGHAFEQFFSSVFRGDLGQYFTRRELVRFICGVLKPIDTDMVLDPTAGSGGFLLETLLQVWRYVGAAYAGQPDVERKRLDFALNNVFGIEIHATLARVCKTNLLIHKDGHTNIEGERSCLDSAFSLPQLRPDGSVFTMVLGNPPFGDDIKDGDRDRLGDGRLSDFEIARGRSQISSELVVLERSIQFLVPGGRLGMVVPDGMLNNSGEGSMCPAFRRYLLRHAKIELIVSLPDYAFRKAGAQNKTSLLFLRKFTVDEKASIDARYEAELQNMGVSNSSPSPDQDKAATISAIAVNGYSVFLAEVDRIGYTPAGSSSQSNQLYSVDQNDQFDYSDAETVLGQYSIYLNSPGTFAPTQSPSCHSLDIKAMLDAHDSLRLDPKFHLFQLERLQRPPAHMTEYRLGDLLQRREEEVDPQSTPNSEFLTLTLSQNGSLSPREAGKGINPPSWHGAYFSDGSRWFRARKGDLIISQIDVWKGCIAVIPEEYDQAIVTAEFPLYRVRTRSIDINYLALLLRSAYFQRAIRAITTGHSNRRRTQSADFEDLRIFLPDKRTQTAIASLALRQRSKVRAANDSYQGLLESLEQVIIGLVDPLTILRQT